MDRTELVAEYTNISVNQPRWAQVLFRNLSTFPQIIGMEKSDCRTTITVIPGEILF